MPSVWKTRSLVILVVTILATMVLAPTLGRQQLEDPSNRDSWPAWMTTLDDWFGGAAITWGLDLQGGLHLQYRVDVDKAISDKLNRFASELSRSIREEHPEADFSIERISDTNALRASGSDVGSLLNDDELRLMNLLRSTEVSGDIRLELDPAYIEETRAYALEQAIETIRKRIDSTGVAEPSISRRGNSDIIVQLPGLDEQRFEEMKSIIARTAQLEFQMVADQNDTFIPSLNIGSQPGITAIPNRIPFADTPENLRAAVENVDTPAGTEIGVEKRERVNPETGAMEVVGYYPILLEDTVELTGEYISDARVSTDSQTNQPVVLMNFDSEGARIFAELTTANVGRRFAIILDEQVSSAPVINSPIVGGSAQISMGNRGSQLETMREAEALSVVLRNGALPAPIEKQFETQVGPSLGADSVKAGATSLAIAFGLVVLFVLFWYRIPGVFTTVALLLNVLLIGAALALVGATMTLPGIAGITLTIGMAVDANVIIFERIKEELSSGQPLRTAVDAGYEKALSAVLDANITTAIAGLVLLEFGSGPIRGFAVTLLIGIASSLFTALYVTRTFFDISMDAFKVQRIRI